MIKKILLWTTAAVLSTAAVLTVLTFGYFWRSPAYYDDPPAAAAGVEDKIIKQAEYSDDHPNPYVYRSGNVVVFGAEHTKDPNNPQIEHIEREWDNLAPTVALVEGRLGFLAPGLMDPVKKYGESGYVLDLAKADDGQAYSWEMPQNRLTQALAERHPKDRVALFLVLRPYFSNLRHGKPESPEKFVEEFLGRAADPAVVGAIGSVADIDRIWSRDFPQGPNWRNVSDEYPLPGYLQTIADDANDLRNRHLLRTIFDLSAKGERVFVVAGSSHAVLLEPAVRATTETR